MRSRTTGMLDRNDEKASLAYPLSALALRRAVEMAQCVLVYDPA